MVRRTECPKGEWLNCVKMWLIWIMYLIALNQTTQSVKSYCILFLSLFALVSSLFFSVHYFLQVSGESNDSRSLPHNVSFSRSFAVGVFPKLVLLTEYGNNQWPNVCIGAVYNWCWCERETHLGFISIRSLFWKMKSLLSFSRTSWHHPRRLLFF